MRLLILLIECLEKLIFNYNELFFFLLIFLYAIIIKPIVKIIMSINNPIKMLLINTVSIKSAKYAINTHHIIAPIDMARKIFQGFIPTNRPTIEPTRPPDP